MQREGNAWSLEYDDGVVVGRFHQEMPLSAFEEEAYPAFEEIVGEYRDQIVGTADLIEVEESLGDDVLSVWEDAANASSELPNYQRGALVADGLTKLALQNKLRVPNAEIQAFGDLDAAIRWARGE